MNLQQYRSRVKLNLTREFVDKHDIRDAQIDSVINDYYVKCSFNTQIVKRNFTITTVANQISYDLDPSFMLIERVYYDITTTSGSHDFGEELDEVSKSHYEGTAEYGTPTCYWLEQPHSASYRKIYFWPTPSTAGLTIRVKAIIYPELLVEGITTMPNQLPAILDQVIIQGASAELGAIGKGIPNQRYFAREFKNNLEGARVLLSNSSRNRRYKTVYKETWD